MSDALSGRGELFGLRMARSAHSLRLDWDMKGTSSQEERPELERFHGTLPSGYCRWRRKAHLLLLALPSTFTKDRWGAKLSEYLSAVEAEGEDHQGRRPGSGLELQSPSEGKRWMSVDLSQAIYI